MSGRAILKGAVDQSTVIRILDSADGTPETGVVAATSGLALSYRREGAAVVALAALNDLATLATAHADGGILHIGAGYYRVDAQDAAFATGSAGVLVFGTCTGMVIVGTYHALVDLSLEGQSAADLKDFADDGYDPSTNKVQGVVLTDTVTTYTGNTPQTGDSFARLGVPAGASIAADLLVIDNLVDDLETRLGTPSDLGSGATVAANLVDIEGQADEIGIAGAGLTAVPWNAAWDAEVQSEVDAALVAHRLDELLNADSDIDGAAPPTVGSVFHELLTKAAGSFTYDQTTDSLEALRDRGDAAWTTGGSAPTAADIRAEIDSNSTQLALIVADSNELQTDWANGGRLDVILDARASQTSLDTLDDLVDTEVGAIKDKTDQLTFTVANRVDSTTQAGVSTLSAADVRTAVGLASANLDTQLGDLPTNAELATALTGATIAAVSGAVGSVTAGVTLGANAVSAVALATDAVNEIVAAIKALVVETEGSYTLGQALSILLAVLAGVTDDAGSTLKSPNGVATRVAATVSGSQERTAMVLTPSA